MGKQAVKLLILADVAGSPMLSPYSVKQASKIFTHEINWVIKGAYKGGISEVYVRDRTKKGDLIHYHNLDQRAQLVEGPLLPDCGFECVKSMSCAFLIGTSGEATSKIRSDSFIHGSPLKVEVNGEALDETELLTLALREFDIPVVLISGESNAGQKYKDKYPFCQVVYTKNNAGESAVRSVHPDELERRYEGAAKEAITRFMKNPPTLAPLRGHYDCQVTLTGDPNSLAWLSLIPWVKTDFSNNQISFYISSAIQLYRFVNFIRLGAMSQSL